MQRRPIDQEERFTSRLPYFSDNWPLLADIHSILAFDTEPAERFGLIEMTEPRGKYYVFRTP